MTDRITPWNPPPNPIPVITETGALPAGLSLVDDGNGTGAGDLFGIDLAAHDSGVLFVDDFDNTLRLLH